jgi:FkbM family methyltransferase
MSKNLAAILNGFIRFSLLPVGQRQKQKTLARLTRDLQASGSREITTDRGALKFLAMRGAGIASAVETFHSDEPETHGWIRTYIKPGDVLWDIGASVGMYALYAALDKSIRVYAFEPSALNFSLLVEHIALNEMGDRVMPVCMALSDETRMNVLHMGQYDPGSAGNALGGAATQTDATIRPLFMQGVPAITGDDFARTFKAALPDHIKLDVDGIEGAILRGMPDVLRHAKTVIIEVEGMNASEAHTRIDPALKAAGLEEDLAFRSTGSGRNRLYINKTRAA